MNVLHVCSIYCDIRLATFSLVCWTKPTMICIRLPPYTLGIFLEQHDVCNVNSNLNPSLTNVANAQNPRHQQRTVTSSSSKSSESADALRGGSGLGTIFGLSSLCRTMNCPHVILCLADNKTRNAADTHKTRTMYWVHIGLPFTRKVR